MIEQHGAHWIDASREALAGSILAHPARVRAVSRGKTLPIRRYPILPATMGPRPVALEHRALPDLPTPADLARWLGIIWFPMTPCASNQLPFCSCGTST